MSNDFEEVLLCILLKKMYTAVFNPKDFNVVPAVSKVYVCLQALLLHGSLSGDDHEVSLSLGEGVENAEQQLV